MAQSADMDALVSRTRCKTFIGLPIDIQSWRRVESKLLLVLSCLGVPNDGGSVHASTENVISTLVPLECENGSFVLTEGLVQFAGRRPNSGVAIVRSRGQ